jgi:hypothetical protein
VHKAASMISLDGFGNEFATGLSQKLAEAERIKAQKAKAKVVALAVAKAKIEA